MGDGHGHRVQLVGGPRDGEWLTLAQTPQQLHLPHEAHTLTEHLDTRMQVLVYQLTRRGRIVDGIRTVVTDRYEYVRSQ